MGMKSKLSPAQIDELVRLRNAGQTLAFLAKMYGLSMGRISQICTKYNKEKHSVRVSVSDSDEDLI